LVTLAVSLSFWIYKPEHPTSETEGEKEKTWISDVTPASGPGVAPKELGATAHGIIGYL